MVRLIICKTRKRVGSLKVRAIFQTTPAYIRRVDAKLDSVPAVRPSQRVVKCGVILRLEPVCLCASRCEGIKYNDLWLRLDTAYRLILLPEQDSKVIDQFW